MTSKAELVIPLGDKAFWDTKRAAKEGNDLKNVADSGVLLQSLKQSRDNWLFRTFPKFSSKARGNKDSAPPPHTIQSRGTCDLAVGPHIFPDTVFYEVHYLPPSGYQPSGFSAQPGAANPYWQPTNGSATAGSSTPQKVLNTAANAAVATKADNTASSAPSLDSIPSAISLTPSLIQHVNFAASSNPTLANLLQLAAAGKASHDQLQTLGLLIQSFANLESLHAATGTATQPFPSSSTTPYSYYQRTVIPPVKEFDLVLEFREAPNERWIFPRVPVYTERQPAPDAPNDLDVSMLARVPFDQKTSPAGMQYPVTFVLKGAPYTIWETVWGWVGGEERNKANKAQIEISEIPPRLYPGHQLPSGQLLAQFQAAAGPQYTMKPLKQGPPTHSRPRPKRPRKNVEPIAATGASPSAEVATGETVIVKRARITQSKSAAPIQCISCKNGDVPLILGGKYCRPCAEIEKQKAGADTTQQPFAAVVETTVPPVASSSASDIPTTAAADS
ncbi:hypothetical protein CPB83DRAFT_855502 [Crepidotus variabilis]|uniref:Uncharacterized protein n=1 Tax=Crepidotus variabilis TaxID=179855 RepID=A0A9P6JPL5_9AGAR|nr:hypothetical protein CPB83DRAFT_855502 [Crepidotus variabilis]